ncbi:hypothetical protein GGI01_001055 [Coemansia sp. RSA 376]|nr:hypothetical protein LPJ71_003373 [Coemansia sp. S17]KAJ2013598.1 hypothetical protein GGI14_005295 [Coemansia sp. S680]KAJ2033522.1 hypothetical protein H4S03_005604 [Coemansia sp. S3946]KAJ2037586.1 hypothetical protein GGI08_008460 [Coemansia sp. S2]KAJ2042566.1 hypothetical protein H4S04_007230 [Coemansia sp. S16]KAJ2066408.1 hypothetical protein GGH13_005723 [Coemansia sp. S155-1]KAJ2072856.1 hypothetical protein GGI09_009040 [Coemansia sp. S100]KAJ2101262.1 hypothetical protein GGI1
MTSSGRGGVPDPEYLAERRVQREKTKFSIWAPSPTVSEDEACRVEEDAIIAKLQGRIDERNRELAAGGDATDSDSSSGTDSRSDSERSDRKKSKRKSSRNHSKRSKRSSKESESKRSSKDKKRSKSSRHKSRSSKSSKHSSSRRHRRRHESDYSDSSSEVYSDDDNSRSRSVSPRARREPKQASRKPAPTTELPVEQLSDQEIGPMPSSDRLPALSARSFGGALLPGEGSAMAAYVQSGERIPRRGEIGVDQDMIERLENSGYVMSGNRHRRMNAVRVRKENQVISAEEKRQMLLQNQEERLKKETQIITEFRDMLSKKQ